MKYQVVIGDDSVELEENVNIQIGNGWRPFGGVAVSVNIIQQPDAGLDWDYVYAQAMTRED